MERPGYHPGGDLGVFIPSSLGHHGNQSLLYHGKVQEEALKGVGELETQIRNPKLSLHQCRVLGRVNCNHPQVEAILVKLINYPGQVIVSCSCINGIVLFGGSASCSVYSACFAL